MKAVFTIICALSVGSVAWGQELAAVPKELKDLSGLVGEWQGELAMTIPGMSDPIKMTSTVSVKVFGQYQETVYTMDAPGMGKFTGHQFLTWDENAKGYKSWNFDDQSPAPRMETGSWDGKKLVMSGEQGGMTSRVTFEPRGKDVVHFLLEMKQGDSFVKLGETDYKRKA
ncbi:MAG: DUF1579 family protein [Armatimonadetes bacterium]|nr:DUF1579 family protein [Armatimonadota bacterium]